jgi:predicted AlkP superfamily phosphohydrolase/phosphomutase
MSDLESSDEKVREKTWEIHRKLLESNDRMVAKLVEAAGPDALVILVSDHGAVPDGPMFDPYDALIPAGLSVLKRPRKTQAEMNGQEAHNWRIGWGEHSDPDYTKTKAVPQRTCYVYVNLKGRDVGGIVEPDDYEKVQQEIIDALYTYVDPETGKRPVALALTKRDARIFGHYGDRVGDVVYAIQPWFGSQHGPILPTAEYSVGSLHSLFVLTGPGVKKGFRMQRTCWLTDIVPTICYLMDWPVPQHVEGAVLYQAFDDHNFQMKEIQGLKKQLAEMEEALKK